LIDINHWPLWIYQDENNPKIIYFNDQTEGLTFERTETSPGKFDLTVIVEEGCKFQFREEELSATRPWGIVVLEDISFAEWKKLAKDYLRNLKDEKRFNQWIHKIFYKEYENTWYDSLLELENYLG